MRQLVTMDEAAKHFKISRRTFSTLINNTPVKYFQVGKQKRFDLSELEKSFERVSAEKEVGSKETISRKRSAQDNGDYARFYALLE